MPAQGLILHTQKAGIALIQKQWFHVMLILGMGITAFSLAYTHQKKLPAYNWQSWLWADQTGYYIYLPATFIYEWDADRLPENIMDKTGLGFETYAENKIFTRYTSGVSFFQLPFFAVGHLLSGISGSPQDGFSSPYIFAQIAGGGIWGTLGLFFLYLFLSARWSTTTAMFTLIAAWAGTPLIFYHSYGNGMSHIYCFTLIAFLLWYVNRSRKPDAWFWIITGGISGWMILIRPTHVLTVAVIFAYFLIDGRKELWTSLLKPLHICVAIIAAAIFWVPQLMYWHHLSGHWIMDSYQGYGFSNLSNPELIKFWFSPRNGLFTYAPVMFIFASLTIWQIVEKQYTAILIMVFFLFSSYLFSSWFMWYFGCGFGNRNFVDTLPLWVIPFSQITESSLQWGRIRRNVFMVITLLCLIFTCKMLQGYDKCHTGKGDWDWKEFQFDFIRSSKRSKFSNVQIAADSLYYPLYQEYKENTTPKRYKELLISGTFESEPNCKEVFVVVNGSLGGESYIYNQSDICISKQGRFDAYFEVDDKQKRPMLWSVYLWNPKQQKAVIKHGNIRFR
jgi:hypothetical protein